MTRNWRLDRPVFPVGYGFTARVSTCQRTSPRVSRHAAAAVMIIALVGCARPQPDPVLTPGTVRAWQANQAVIALGDVQRTAITYHSAAMLSEANTRVVVEAVTPALERIKAAPPSWKPVGLGALTTIDKGLDGNGRERMDVHVAKARSTLNGL